MNAHRMNRTDTNSIEKNYVYLWYGIFLLWSLFMMDVVTTEVIISSGGYEMNGIMQPFIESPVLHTSLKMAVLGLVAVVAYLSDKMTKRYGTIAITGIVAWYTFVIAHNIIQMVSVLS